MNSGIVQGIIADIFLNFKITMTAKVLLFILILTISTYAQISVNSSSQSGGVQLPTILPCVAYQNAQCVTCPFNYHINQNQCYINITDCLTYRINNLGREECTQCDPAKAVSDGKGGCTSSMQTMSLNSQSLSNSIQQAQRVAANFGDNRFVIISLEAALNDPYFRIVNNFMLNGEYKHFISRTAQPIVSVSYFAVYGQNQYKILYNGSGGGLMMAIISITTSTNAIQLSSFVPIGITNVIDNCGAYDLSLNCVQCLHGWHLENGFCYRNIEGCTAYSQTICLYCIGYAILVENRCVTCTQMGDLNKITFFRGLGNWISTNQLPTLSQAYLYA